ncbi:MAG: MFS transporter [Betaproteobacteria bacterium]
MKDSDSLLSQLDFRRVWLAGLCGGTIRWLDVVVIGIYVFEVTHSAFQASFIATLRFLPFAPAGPILGFIAERFGLRRTYFALMVLVLATALVQGLLALAGRLEVWHLAVGSFLSGFHWAAELPLRRTLLAAQAPPLKLVPAMALDSMTNNITKMVGPLVGGVILQAVGLSGTFGLAVVLHGITLAQIRALAPEPPLPRRETGFFRNLREGFAIARGNRMVMLALGLSLVFNLFGFPAVSMIPVIGEQRLELSAAMIGVLTAAEGIGAVVGSLLVVRFGSHLRYHGRFFALGIIFFMLMMDLVSFSASFSMAAWSLLGAGLGMACFSTMQSTLVLMASPEETRGRLMGLLSVFIGVGPLGFLLLGWMAEHLGAAMAVQIMVLEGLISWVLVCWLLRDVILIPSSRLLRPKPQE